MYEEWSPLKHTKNTFKELDFQLSEGVVTGYFEVILFKTGCG